LGTRTYRGENQNHIAPAENQTPVSKLCWTRLAMFACAHSEAVSPKMVAVAPPPGGREASVEGRIMA
jgi:hypothetical protein